MTEPEVAEVSEAGPVSESVDVRRGQAVYQVVAEGEEAAVDDGAVDETG